MLVDSLANKTVVDPVDVVDLSDRAKQVLARANTEQAAADKLTDFLRSLKDPDGTSASSRHSSKEQVSLFEKLKGQTTGWTAGSKAGDASISDADFITKYRDAFEAALQDFPADKRAEMEAAISNGTLQIQKGSDIDGYNTKTTVTYNVGPGGGQGMSTSGYRAPTGATKEAIESGNAISLWTEDRGDVFVTW